MSSALTPEEWRLQLRSIRLAGEARTKEKLRKSGRLDLSDEEEDKLDAEVKFYVTVPSMKPEFASLPQKPKALVRDLPDYGWLVAYQRSVTHHEDKLWVGTSKEDAKDSHNAGEVRTPAHDVEHFSVQAILPEVARFWASWDRPEGKNNLFTGAVVWDVTFPMDIDEDEDPPRPYLATAGEFYEWLYILTPGLRPAPKPEKEPAPAETGVWIA